MSHLITIPLILFTLVLGVERMVSYRANTKVFFTLPLNQIARDCPQPTSYTVDPTQRPKICLTTLTDAAKAGPWQKLVKWRNFDNLLDMTWPNKVSYCERHGYQLFNESLSLDRSRPPSWSKIRAAQRLLQNEDCDWVFWMDADTVIMNSTIRIEDFLPSADVDLVLTQQKGASWNAGAWLIRKSEWSLAFLDHWWNMKEFVKPKGMAVSGDNDALKAYLKGMDTTEFEAHIRVPPRCLFNSVAKFMTADQQHAGQERPEWWYSHLQLNKLESFHKGDFVAHVAGVDNKITTSALLLQDAI